MRSAALYAHSKTESDERNCAHGNREAGRWCGRCNGSEPRILTDTGKTTLISVAGAGTRGSIGLAQAFLAGGGPGGIAPTDPAFVKKVVDENNPPTRVNDLSRLLGEPLAKESEHTVLLALYLAATLGTRMFLGMSQREVDQKARGVLQAAQRQVRRRVGPRRRSEA